MSAASPGQRNLLIGCGLVLLGALGFSAKAIFIKLAYAAGGQIDAISLMTLRMLFSLPFFLAVVLWHNRKSPAEALTKKQWAVIAVLGLMGYYIASYLDFIGLLYISAGLERIILFLYPTFVVLFSALMHKKGISLREMVALALSYAGMIMVFVEQLSMESAGIWLGSSLVLAGAVVFACFTMGSGVMGRRIGSARFTAYTMTIASIATIVHFSVGHGLALTGFPAEVYKQALLMAVFSTVLPSFFMNAGIRRVGAGSASIISMIGPIATLVLAFLFLGEPITIMQLSGTVFVLAGVFVISRAKS
ncbi:DMT family transporter [Methylobacter sp. BlB1]|uniref:DMT family transporter n=1 Tax=Methylobacter sp. BlB1 TaxID=2785914 RepID=UPI001894D61C|nr:DMT family transporter [Methylobacter sp. BlB1]MBF6650526.1 DMT family transporter [Methylobacter sp. BlB1]